MSNMDIRQNIDKIELQVERWDLFARLVPTVFLIIHLTLVTFGIISFETAFWTGLGLFAVTAVTWWFWTIYTIRHLIRTLNRATKNLDEVQIEFLQVSKDFRDLKK